MDECDSEKKTATQPTLSEPEEQQDKTSPGRPIQKISWSLIVISILTTTFLFGLDNTIVADIQPAIVSQFGSVNKLPWLSVAFLVSAASTTLFW